MTTVMLRPCMWGLALAGLLMTTSPVAAELPVAVFYDMTDEAVLASPQTIDRAGDQSRTEMPRQQAERVDDAQIHQP